MAPKFVVASFETEGIAGDSCNRLKYQGVPEADILLLLLRELAMAPSTVSAELEGPAVDPLILGNVQETCAPYISNGETAVFVQAHNEADVEQAVLTLQQYSPLRIMTVWVEEGVALGRDLL
jgi:hypothetical protein